ncbi:MAG TPA: hypothetical protein VK941_01590, partial [Gillisia sp.]|nr:hypothetical protein [Gillisia sp.]
MIRKISAIGLLAVAVVGCQTQGKVAGNSNKSPNSTSQSSGTNNGLKSYSEVITSQSITDEGLF